MSQQQQEKNRSAAADFRQGLQDGIAICIGYLAVSFAFGIQAHETGLTAVQAAAMSFLNVTSAGQFSALELIFRQASLMELALLQLVVNLRYLLMSTALSQKFAPQASLLQRLGTAYGVTDEIFTLSVLRPGTLTAAYSAGIIGISVFGWVAGTALGAGAGQILPERLVSALGIAIYGMFLAIILPESRKNRPVLIVVLCAMVISALMQVIPFLAVISSGFRIIIVTLLVAGVAAAISPVPPEPTDGGAA
ncbi:MAG: AzlC family ABC transporter permease [Butyrivibrio sp.]|nr:AzlC family ABC transporter permease [Butyrivibrio sp.]